ncbi:MAG: hypothetical protein AB7W59_25215 [Acidimicrobiia bacterium]
MRRWPLVVLVAAATVLLSGCFRYESTLTVREDGSGTVQELLLVNRAVAEQLLESDTDVRDHLPRAADFDLPDWVVVRDHATDGYQGVLLDVSFRDPGELNQRLNLLHQFLASTVGSVATSQVELQELDDGWQFTMFTKDLAEVPGPAGTDPSGYADQYHDAELTIVVELPGLITAHNADEQVGNRLVWRLSARAVQTQLYARTSTNSALLASARTDTGLRVATAVATLGGAAVFAAVAVERRRRTGREGAGEVALARLGDPVPGAAPPPPQQWPASPPTGPPVLERPPHALPPQRGPGQ